MKGHRSMQANPYPDPMRAMAPLRGSAAIARSNPHAVDIAPNPSTLEPLTLCNQCGRAHPHLRQVTTAGQTEQLCPGCRRTLVAFKIGMYALPAAAFGLLLLGYILRGFKW